MKKKRTMPLSVAITVLVLLLVAFIVQMNFRQPEGIVLPPEQSAQEPESGAAGEESVHRVSVRPDTVQSAVATLERAENYSRSIVVERFWNGGSSVSTTSVRAAGGWLRMDTTHAGGDVRNVITGDGASYVWYGNEKSYYTAPDVIGEDAEQGILTYEDVLLLPVERIAHADYRAFGELNCIYVETTQEDGYLERYWVDVVSGLLVAAEKDCDGAPVYRMNGAAIDLTADIADAFTLPDGTALYTPAGGA